MKKEIRVFSVVLSLLLCFGLCGCTALDEMRAAQCFRDEGGNILYQDHLYKPLPNDLSVDDFVPEFSYDEYLMVTERDVPVLLSGIMGEVFSVSKDRLFLEGDPQEYYCRTDVYDTVYQQLKHPFSTEGYAVDDVDFEKKNLLSTALNKEIKKALSQKPLRLTNKKYEEFCYLVTIYECGSAPYLLREFAEFYAYEESPSKYRYYIVVTNEYGVNIGYSVSEESKGLTSLLEPYLKSCLEMELDDWDY